MLEFLLVSYELNSDDFLCPVIEAFERLSKAAFAQEFKHLPSVPNVVLKHHFIVASFIVVPEVVGLNWRPFNLFSPYTQVVNLLVV